MIGSAPASSAASVADRSGRFGVERPAGEPACLVRVTQTGDRAAIDRRIGRDDAVDSPREQCARDAREFARVEIGRDLDDQRRVLAVLLRELRLFVLERSEQRVERRVFLQLAQAGWYSARKC